MAGGNPKKTLNMQTGLEKTVTGFVLGFLFFFWCTVCVCISPLGFLFLLVCVYFPFRVFFLLLVYVYFFRGPDAFGVFSFWDLHDSSQP